MYKGISSLTLFLFLALTVFAQTKDEHLKKIKLELMKMNDEDPYKQGTIGFSLRASGGEEVVRFNATKALVPASNMKVLTTATALKVLGEDFKYETKICYTGSIEQGVLNGNIIIQGSGDPTLGSDRIIGSLSTIQLISLFASKIKDAGITKINGTILQDYFCFRKNPIPDGWIWTDIGNYYGAGVYGLNFNENLYNVYFKAGAKPGDSTKITRTDPYIYDLKIDNKVMTGPDWSGDNAYIYGAPYSNNRIISGTIPAGANDFSIKGSLPDPPYLLVSSLYNELKNNGVSMGKAPSNSFDLNSSDKAFLDSRTVIYTYQSPSLRDIIAKTNLNSINLYAESIYRTVESKLNRYSDEMIASYWKSLDIITEGNFIYDGSGLSPQNGIKPSFVTLVLDEIAKDSSFNAFYNSLPVAGESGTLSRFCKGTKAEKVIHAKSGSLAKVIGYSGYVAGKSGVKYSFCILVNNFTGRSSNTVKRIEKIMTLMAEL